MKSKTIDGVTLHELTVAEVYDWLSELAAEEQQPDRKAEPREIVNRHILPDCALEDLARMSSLTLRQMATMPPGTLALLMEECRALNPFFFRLMTGIRTGTFPPLSNSTPLQKPSPRSSDAGMSTS